MDAKLDSNLVEMGNLVSMITDANKVKFWIKTAKPAYKIMAVHLEQFWVLMVNHALEAKKNIEAVHQIKC